MVLFECVWRCSGVSVLHSLGLVLYVASFSSFVAGFSFQHHHETPNILLQHRENPNILRQIGGCRKTTARPPYGLFASTDATSSDAGCDKMAPNMESELVQGIKDHFENSKMMNPTIPLLCDFQSYFSSLPVREDSDYDYRLCNAPYWSSDDSLDSMAKSISMITQPEKFDDKDVVVINSRELIKIKFICAPSGRGKSSSVLPAFLRALELNGPEHIPTNDDDDPVYYYIYMAFANNGGNYFKFLDRVDELNDPESQGAAFMYECLKRLLNADAVKSLITSDIEAYNGRNMTEAVMELVAESFPKGRVIFHLDEHKKMCDDWMIAEKTVKIAEEDLAKERAGLDKANQEFEQVKAREKEKPQALAIAATAEAAKLAVVATELAAAKGANLATKDAELAEIDAELAVMKAELAASKAELAAELAASKAELAAELAAQDAELAAKRAELAVSNAEVTLFISLEAKRNADFRRGALMAMAAAQRATVVATYTDLPDLPPNDDDESSNVVCRDPVALSQRSLKKIGQSVDELSFLSTFPRPKTRELRRLWATLRLRVSFNLDRCIMSIHRRDTFGVKVSGGEAFRALQNFREIKAILLDKSDLTDKERLEQSLRHVLPPKLDSFGATKGPCMMLATVKDTKNSVAITSRLTDLVALRNRCLTQDLKVLLARRDKEYDVFNQGRQRFMQLLENDKDMLSSGKPLVIAYLWAIACRSAGSQELDQELGIGSTFTCKEISDGRLFQETHDLGSFSTAEIQPNTLYAVKEDREGSEMESDSHPLYDLYYCTDDEKEVVLISITEGDGRRAKERVDKLKNFFRTHTAGIHQLRGVCLAPNVGGDLEKEEEDVLDLRGSKALEHLGGLSQISDALYEERDLR